MLQIECPETRELGQQSIGGVTNKWRVEIKRKPLNYFNKRAESQEKKSKGPIKNMTKLSKNDKIVYLNRTNFVFNF